VNRNKTIDGLKRLNDFVNQRGNRNIMTVTASYRYDLLIVLCVNNEVQIVNRKLHTCKIMKNVRILDQETNREDFTQRGLHLNATGKDKVVQLMSQNISQLFESQKNRIILKRRTSHSDRSLVNNI
jgi:hypothetical protein